MNTPRWYMLNTMGMATLCLSEKDAKKEARAMDMAWPHMGPHRAVQLVEAEDVEALRAGYEAARLEIESLRARCVEPAGEYPALPEIKDMHNGPQQLNLSDRAMWVLGWNECRDAARDADRAMRAAQPAGAQQPGAAYAALPYKQALGSTNCMQCCVSYMMGLPLENVPDFATDGGWERFSDFAETQGYVAVMLPGNREYEADYLASGTTARGTSHMVVMNNGKLVHDPHPSNAGLVDVQCVWLLAKRASPTQWQQDEHTAFEASAKTYTSNVSFERDASDYVDMTASLLWHGWKLRASHGQAPAPAQAAHQQEAPAMHSGWVSCTIEFDGSGPEEVAYGPKIMMDRLAKWLGKHFERTIAEKAAPQPLPASQGDALDAERLDWLTFNLSGKALRDIGVVWSEHGDARRAIDAARAAQEGK